ncbi:MAG: glycosyltransferase family 4 protein, partial [Gemmatimonadaceae bacterium]
FWTAQYAPYIGGVEVMATALVAGLRERGHDVCVVTSHGDLELPDVAHVEGVPVHRFDFHGAIARRDLEKIVQVRRRLVELKRTFRPDLIHLNITEPSFLFHYQTLDAWPATMVVTLPVFVPEGTTAKDSLLGRAFQDAAWVIAPSMAVLRDTHQLVPGIAPRSSVIYNGLEMPRLNPGPIPFDPPRILAIGRVVEEKGFDTAISAFARIRRRFPRARLVVAGDGPARKALERQAAELGISYAVDFLGWIAPRDVPRLIAASTMVLQPSRWREAFGLVALQAGQMARPAVSTTTGGIPEVVVDGETGLLVEPDDPAALADAMAYLLDHPDVAARMGAAGRQRALTFTMERHVTEHDALYRQLVKENAHAVSA